MRLAPNRFFFLVSCLGLAPLVVGCQAAPALLKNLADSSAIVTLSEQQQQEAKLHVVQAGLAETDPTVRTAGRVTYNDLFLSHVFSPVTGRVDKILAHPGQKVHVGDPLAVILSPDIGIASSDVEKALADLQQGSLELARQKKLRGQNASSVHDLDAAQDNFERARAEYRRSAEKSALLGERPRAHAFAHPHIGQRFLLRALIEGDVVYRHINPGVEIQGQYAGGVAEELYTIADGHQMWVMAEVRESDIGRVRVGQDVRVRVDAYPDREVLGKIDYVANILNPNTRTATVRCSLPNQESLLKPNMFASVSIHAPGARRLSIARTALFRLGEKAFVYRALPNQATAGITEFRRWPILVDEDVEGPFVPLRSGLQAGDRALSGDLESLFSKPVR